MTIILEDSKEAVPSLYVTHKRRGYQLGFFICSNPFTRTKVEPDQ